MSHFKPSTYVKYALGIDLSKKDFKACFCLVGGEGEVKVKATGSFANSTSGFESFFKWVNKHIKEELPVFYLMEATGIYYEQLAWYLYQREQKVSVILPNKAKSYLQSIGNKSKNDKIDAQGLARMCAERYLPLWRPLSKNIYLLRSLTRLHESLTKQRTVLNNQLQASKASMYELKDVLKILSESIATMDKQLKITEKQIAKLIEEDAILKGKYEKMRTIKGVGVLTFAVVIAETNGFELFENQRQLISYAGYDVVENQSGSRVGKTRISKKGNSRIRRILHMPAFSVVAHDEGTLKALHERVYQRSGLKMKAYVAVQKKLLCLLYTLWKKDSSYEKDYQKKATSSNKEPKPLFPVVFKENQIASLEKKEVAPSSRATQDELPCNKLPEALFPVEQMY
jgi:transposase